MDFGNVKLLIAMALFSAPVILCAEALPKREIAGRRITRVQAQVVGAVLGLSAGIGFLLATG